MPTNILIEKMPRLIVLLLFCGSIHNVFADNPAYGTESEIKLKQVDLPKDTILYDIVKREISNTHSSKEKVKFYSVYLSDYEDGTMVTIVSELYDNIFGDTQYNGYYIMDGHTIVFHIDGKYKLPYVKPSKSLTFKTYTPFPCPYDPSETQYFIFHGAYTWKIKDIGWVWVVPDNIIIGSKNNNTVVTVPKRTSK